MKTKSERDMKHLKTQTLDNYDSLKFLHKNIITNKWNQNHNLGEYICDAYNIKYLLT